MLIKTTKKEMENLYLIQNLGSKSIAKIFKVSPNYIRKVLRSFGIPIKPKKTPVKYHANHTFFDNWSHEMAYCLGFIAADGHVWKERPYLTIGIHKRDYKTLEFIRNCISPTSKIRPYKDKIQINIHSERIHKRLHELGIVHNKTFILKIDFDIPEEYWGSYLRGLFDGDGSIWRCKFRPSNPYYYYSDFISASYEYLKYIRDRLGFGVLRKIKNKYYELKFCQSESLMLFEIMYKNNCYRMERKYKKFLKIKPQARKWQPKEIEILIQYNKDKDKLIELLPNRTWESIKTKKNLICRQQKSQK